MQTEICETGNAGVVEAEGGHSARIDLPDQATKINAATQAAEASAKSALTHALTAGRLLIEAKAAVDHGSWEKWVIDNCTVAPRTGRAYMKLAESYPKLGEPYRQRVADMPLRDAIRAISIPAEGPKRSIHWSAPGQLAKRTEAYRVGNTFSKSADALTRAAKELHCAEELKPSRMEALRKRLTDALSDLDRLAAANSPSYAAEESVAPMRKSAGARRHVLGA